MVTKKLTSKHLFVPRAYRFFLENLRLGLVFENYVLELILDSDIDEQAFSRKLKHFKKTFTLQDKSILM